MYMALLLFVQYLRRTEVSMQSIPVQAKAQVKAYLEPMSGVVQEQMSSFGILQVQPSKRLLEMQRTPEGEGLEPQQLSRLLDWLTQASPAILVRPQASASTAEAGADRKDAEMREWLCELATASSSTRRSIPFSVSWPAPNSLKIVRLLGKVIWPWVRPSALLCAGRQMSALKHLEMSSKYAEILALVD